MIIAINTGFTGANLHYNNSDILFECFTKLALSQPQHQFIFIVDKDFDEKLITPENCIAVVAGSATTNPLLLQYRLNYTIPALLRKHKAHVFVSNNFCSLHGKLPQCVFIDELSFIAHPELYPNNWLRFFKKNISRSVALAKTIVTSSGFLKQLLIRHYKKDDAAITIVQYGAGELFRPLGWQEKDAVKERYSEGLEYFLYCGPIDPKQNLIELLKAFSVFKKLQKSNMQLIIASGIEATNGALIKSLASYKYRNDVKLLDKLPVSTLAKLTGAGYALVYPSVYENFAGAIPAAMQCNIPVIAGNGEAIKKTYADSILYVNTSDFNDIADKMMLLFKNEDRRNVVIEKGRQFAAQFDRETAIYSLWQAIKKAVDTSS